MTPREPSVLGDAAFGAITFKFRFSRLNHLFTAVHTSNADFARCADAHTAARTEIFARGAFLSSRNESAVSRVSASAADTEGLEVLTAKTDFGQSVFEAEGKQFVARQ